MVAHRNEKVYEDIYKELEVIAMEDPSLRKAFEKWEVLSGTKEEIAAYQARMKRLYDEQSMIGEAELRGEARGREEGIEIGKVNALAETALQLLVEKFGDIPADIKESIAAADFTALNRLLVSIFKITDVQDVRKYFP